MKRVTLLALLSMALPTAALATSINFTTGTFQSGTISGSFQSGQNIAVTLVGSTNTISFNTGMLTALPTGGCTGSNIPGALCYSFTGGSVTVMSGGSTVFTDSLAGGVLTMEAGGTVLLNVGLAGTGSISSSSNLTGTIVVTSTTVTSGFLGVNDLVAPEPSTLGLLGTGLIGLAAIVRRKFKSPS